MARAFKKASRMRARVGILGAKDKRTEGPDGNSDIGAKHEFGYFVSEGPFKGARVPARSFLRMPITVKKEAIAAGLKEVAPNMLLRGMVKEFFVRMGIEAEKVIRQAFDTSGWGTWAPNALNTVILKESDKPLIDTGSLARSISSRAVVK